MRKAIKKLELAYLMAKKPVENKEGAEFIEVIVIIALVVLAAAAFAGVYNGKIGTWTTNIFAKAETLISGLS